MTDATQSDALPTPDRYAGYALPLVAPLFQATNVSEDNPGRREKSFLDVFESSLKYVVTILICRYRADRFNDPGIEETLQRLSRPSLGHYGSLLRDILRLYAQLARDRVAEIQEFYEESVSQETFEQVLALSEIVKYPTPKNARSYRHLIDVLIRYRNKLSHGATVSGRQYQQRLPLLIALIGALLERLRFLGEVPLVEVKSVRHRREGTEAEVRIWNGVLPRTGKRSLEPEHPIGHLVFEGSAEDLGTVDLFPYCVALEGTDGSPDLFFLNGTTRSKVRYLCYYTGKEETIDSRHATFAATQTALQGKVEAGGEGLPGHMQDLLEISDQSRMSFNRALAELSDGEVDNAIVQLEHAIEDSPAYRDAVQELTRLLELRDQLESCHATLDAYLELVANDTELLLEDARVLLKLGRPQESDGRVRQLLQFDPDHPGALAFKKGARSYQKTLRKINEDTKSRARAQLPYEFFVSCIAGTTRNSKRTLAGIVATVTLLEAAVFVYANDLMMALTILSLGATWGSTVWAAFRIRRLLGESRPNFMAFLHSRKGYELRQLLDDLILPVFGRFPEPARSWATVASGFRLNAGRFTWIAVFAAGGTAWLLLITNYSAPSWEINPSYDLSYSLFGFAIFVSFGYLLSNTIGYYKFLRDLRSQTIHFSLVQHPKLSIRYLSNLSRRLSYPLLVVSTLATFTLYLGPFIPKLTFIIGLLVFLVFVSYSYYSTIFLVRRVIIQNKWRLISQFSVHFDAPFDDLIVHAKTSDLSRLKELIEMRDFIDSMDVWAERKSVLVAVSLFYIGVLLFSTLGISNAMTAIVVPAIAKSIEKGSAERVVKHVSAQREDIRLVVRNVDDTVLAFWGTSLDEMLGHDLPPMRRAAIETGGSLRFPLPFPEHPFWRLFPQLRSASESEECERLGGRGASRDDWRNSNHGALNLCVPHDEGSRHLLVVVYNKIYKSFLYMGGGKLSYDIDVAYGKPSVFHTQRTFRSNEKSVGYWGYFHFGDGEALADDHTHPRGEIDMLRIESGAQIPEREAEIERRIRTFVANLGEQLGKEKGAEVDFLKAQEQAETDVSAQAP